MQAPYGLWSMLGNHDALTDPNRVTDSLLGVGIHVLANQSVPIEGKGARFWLGGVDDVLKGSADLDARLHKIPADDPVILLAHEPDHADHVARYRVDLQLSGHSHGGQVRVPLLRPLRLAALARKHILGLYKIGGLTLYTNPGLGTVGVPLRCTALLRSPCWRCAPVPWGRLICRRAPRLYAIPFTQGRAIYELPAVTCSRTREFSCSRLAVHLPLQATR
jgi:predicted MPP superfamily phosphohydrolase